MAMPAGPWAARVRRAPGALGEVLVCLQVPAPFAAAMGRLFGPLLQGPPRPPPHALAGSGLPGRDARGVGSDGGVAGLPPLLECAHERSLLLFPGSLSSHSHSTGPSHSTPLLWQPGADAVPVLARPLSMACALGTQPAQHLV